MLLERWDTEGVRARDFKFFVQREKTREPEILSTTQNFLHCKSIQNLKYIGYQNCMSIISVELLKE